MLAIKMGDLFGVAHCRYYVGSMPSRRWSVRRIVPRIKIVPSLSHQQLCNPRQLLNRPQHHPVRAIQLDGKIHKHRIQRRKASLA